MCIPKCTIYATIQLKTTLIGVPFAYYNMANIVSIWIWCWHRQTNKKTQQQQNNKTHRELQFALCAKSERTLTPSIRCGIFLARCNFCFSFLFFFGSTVQWFSFRIPRAAPPNEMFLFSLVLVLDSFFFFLYLVRYMVFTCCFLSIQLTTDRDWKF